MTRLTMFPKVDPPFHKIIVLAGFLIIDGAQLFIALANHLHYPASKSLSWLYLVLFIASNIEGATVDATNIEGKTVSTVITT